MKVQELMSTPAMSCREQDSLDTATGMMWERDCGALPVVDDTDTIIGVITDRDICMASHTQGKCLEDMSVAEITNGEVFSVGPDDTVRDAEQVMREHQVRRLPVIDERDRVVGMLSLNDIAREGQRERSQKTRQITGDEVLHTLAAIGEPNSQPAHIPV